MVGELVAASAAGTSAAQRLGGWWREAGRAIYDGGPSNAPGPYPPLAIDPPFQIA